MKRLTVLLIALISCIANVCAQDSIAMVSYEQQWSDHEGTLALKNNTSKTIKSVDFTIEYLNMKDVPMDYKTFHLDVEIAPFKTKKVDIPAYEHSRNYYYYKSSYLPYSDHTPFKIKFELNGYNDGKDNEAVSSQNDDTSDFSNDYTDSKHHSDFSDIAFVIALLLVLSLYIGIFVLVGVMARRRGRSAAVWILFSFFATPFLIILILLLIGPAHHDEY